MSPINNYNGIVDYEAELGFPIQMNTFSNITEMINVDDLEFDYDSETIQSDVSSVVSAIDEGYVQGVINSYNECDSGSDSESDSDSESQDNQYDTDIIEEARFVSQREVVGRNVINTITDLEQAGWTIRDRLQFLTRLYHEEERRLINYEQDNYELNPHDQMEQIDEIIDQIYEDLSQMVSQNQLRVIEEDHNRFTQHLYNIDVQHNIINHMDNLHNEFDNVQHIDYDDLMEYQY